MMYGFAVVHTYVYMRKDCKLKFLLADIIVRYMRVTDT